MSVFLRFCLKKLKFQTLQKPQNGLKGLGSNVQIWGIVSIHFDPPQLHNSMTEIKFHLILRCIHLYPQFLAIFGITPSNAEAEVSNKSRITCSCWANLASKAANIQACCSNQFGCLPGRSSSALTFDHTEAFDFQKTYSNMLVRLWLHCLAKLNFAIQPLQNFL